MTMHQNTHRDMPQNTPSGTTTSDPQQLRQEIEQTRANLSQNVNALGEAVAPSSIARRQVDKARGAAVGVKDKVMGSAEGAASSVHDGAAGLGGSIGDGVGGAGRTARSQTRGNPLAAGMIALGAGWLVGSLLPATAKERQAAGRVKEQAQPLVSQAQETAQGVAQHVGQNLEEPAREAAESVKATTQEAVETVKSDGQSAVEDVRVSAEDSRQAVQDHHDRPGTSL